jgi:prophage endopeptidase
MTLSTISAIFQTLARLVLPLAVLALLYAVDRRAEQRGFDRATTQAQKSELDRLSFAIERSGQLATQIGQILDRNQQDKANAQKTIDRLDTDLRSGALRLSIRTTAQAGGNHGAAAGPGQARADIDPADAAALVRIAGAGDDAIRDLNTCIDGYDAVRRATEAGHAQAD